MFFLGLHQYLSTTFCFRVFCGYYFANYSRSISVLFRKVKLCQKYLNIVQNKQYFLVKI